MRSAQFCFSWLSLERGKEGFIAQFSREPNIVQQFRKGEKREEANLREPTFEMTGIQRLIEKDAVTVLQFLESWSLDPKYNLLVRNCQWFVSDAKVRLNLVRNSLDIKFTPPGADKVTVTLDDAKTIVNHVEKMYPSLMEENIVSIPELNEQFAVYTSSSHAETEDRMSLEEKKSFKMAFEFLQCKQKIYNGFKAAADNVTSAAAGNWQVLFSNHSEKSVSEALKFSTITRGGAVRIQKFWREAFDVLFVSPKMGCVIVDVRDLRRSHSHVSEKETNEALQGKKSLLAQLGQIPEEAIRCIVVDMGDTTSESHGDSSTFHLCIGGQTTELELNQFFLKCLLDFNSALKKIAVANVKVLIARLVILNRLEEKQMLLHDKIDNQIWGNPNVAMFTEEQYKALAHGRKAFAQVELGAFQPTRLRVQGCPGAGKTLILVQLARDFVRLVTDKEKKVFFHVDEKHEILFRQMKKLFAGEEFEGRVHVGRWNFYAPELDRKKDSLRQRDLILMDEIDKRSFRWDRQFDLQRQIVVYGTSSTRGSDDGAILVNLSVTLRSTRALTEFIRNYKSQRHGEEIVIEQVSGVAIEGSKPKYIIVKDPSETRNEFFRKSVEYLQGLTRESVCITTPYLK